MTKEYQNNLLDRAIESVAEHGCIFGIGEKEELVLSEYIEYKKNRNEDISQVIERALSPKPWDFEVKEDVRYLHCIDFVYKEVSCAVIIQNELDQTKCIEDFIRSKLEKCLLNGSITKKEQINEALIFNDLSKILEKKIKAGNFFASTHKVIYITFTVQIPCEIAKETEKELIKTATHDTENIQIINDYRQIAIFAENIFIDDEDIYLKSL